MDYRKELAEAQKRLEQLEYIRELEDAKQRLEEVQRQFESKTTQEEFNRAKALQLVDPQSTIAKKFSGEICSLEKTKRNFRPLKQMPLWPDVMRASPTAFLRSALFRLYQKGGQGSFNGAIVASWPTHKITYSGIELGQQHLDTLLQLVHLSKNDMEKTVSFTVNGFMKSIANRNAGGGDYERLRNLITQLSTATIVLERKTDDGRVSKGEKIIEGSFQIHEKGQCCVKLNHKIAKWFVDGYTLLDWDKRKALKTPLAKWMHAFISTHEATVDKPSSINIDKLMKLCGSESNVKRNFRSRLKTAMEKLEKHGIVVNWSITKDVLKYSRKGSYFFNVPNY